MPFLYFAAAAALVGLLPMPYFGYTLVRIGVTAGCLIALSTMPRRAFLGVSSNIWLVAIAVLYNPIAPIFLNRELWIGLDLFVALILILIAASKNDSDTDFSTIRSSEKQTSHTAAIEKPKTYTAKAPYRDISKKIEEKGDSFSSSMIFYGLVLLVVFGIITISLK